MPKKWKWENQLMETRNKAANLSVKNKLVVDKLDRRNWENQLMDIEYSCQSANCWEVNETGKIHWWRLEIRLLIYQLKKVNWWEAKEMKLEKSTYRDWKYGCQSTTRKQVSCQKANKTEKINWWRLAANLPVENKLTVKKPKRWNCIDQLMEIGSKAVNLSFETSYLLLS